MEFLASNVFTIGYIYQVPLITNATQLRDSKIINKNNELHFDPRLKFHDRRFDQLSFITLDPAVIDYIYPYNQTYIDWSI